MRPHRFDTLQFHWVDEYEGLECICRFVLLDDLMDFLLRQRNSTPDVVMLYPWMAVVWKVLYATTALEIISEDCCIVAIVCHHGSRCDCLVSHISTPYGLFCRIFRHHDCLFAIFVKGRLPAPNMTVQIRPHAIPLLQLLQYTPCRSTNANIEYMEASLQS